MDIHGLSDVTAIAASREHTCALRSNGIVTCWGYLGDEPLTDGTSLTPLVPITVSRLRGPATAISGDCAIIKGGRVDCWNQHYPQLIAESMPGLASGVVGITDSCDSCALFVTARVKCWGGGYSGELGNGTQGASATPVDVINLDVGAVAIAASYEHACAISTVGGVKCWGDGLAGEVGDGRAPTSSIPPPMISCTQDMFVRCGGLRGRAGCLRHP